jgi:hypothetical protein
MPPDPIAPPADAKSAAAAAPAAGAAVKPTAAAPTPPAPPAPTVAPAADEAPTVAPEPEPVKSTYRAAIAMGGVQRNGLFEAFPNDPRVLSGYAILIEADEPSLPDELTEVFGQQAPAGS